MIAVPPRKDAGSLTIARAFLIQTTQFNLTPHVTGVASADCLVDRDVQLISALGHQHEWGTHVRAERTAPMPQVLFDHPFDPTLSLHPRVKYFPLDQPFRIKAGDMMRMSCEWNNTTDQAMVFPAEMCVLSGWQIGSERDDMCFDGVWQKF